MDKTVFDHQAQQKRDHDAGARFRERFVGEKVLAYDTRNRTWKGVIAERCDRKKNWPNLLCGTNAGRRGVMEEAY